MDPQGDLAAFVFTVLQSSILKLRFRDIMFHIPEAALIMQHKEC